MDACDITVDEDLQIVRQRITGYISGEDALHISMMMQNAVEKLKDRNNVRICADLRITGKADVRARRIFAQDISRKDMKKCAMWGCNPMVRTIIKFAMIAKGIKNIRIFAREEQAMEWLLEP